MRHPGANKGAAHAGQPSIDFALYSGCARVIYSSSSSWRNRRNESNLKRLQVPLRQLGTRKVPRIRLAFWHGWQRFARYVPVGISSTSPCQPDGTPPGFEHQFAENMMLMSKGGRDSGTLAHADVEI